MFKKIIMNLSAMTLSPKSFRIEKDKIKLEADYEILKAEYAELEARHQKFLQDHLSRTLDSSGLGLSLSNLDRRGESLNLLKSD